VARLDRIPGIVDIRLDMEDGTPTGISFRGPAVVRIGPAPDTCPTPTEALEGERHG
jgi:hypothetical protein